MQVRRQIVKHAIISFLFVASYVLVARPEVVVIAHIGFVMWYPAVGLALGLMLAISPRYAPLVAFSVALVGRITYQQPLISFGETIGAAAVAGIYAMAAHVLRKHLVVDLRLRRRRDVVRYVLVTMTAALLSSAVGTLCLLGDHSITRKEFWRSSSEWFMGDGIGLLGVTPFLLIHIMPRVSRWLGQSGAERVINGARPKVLMSAVAEGVGQLAAIIAAVWVMFGPWERFEHLFLCFIPVIWIAMRQGVKRAATGVMLLNFAIVVASDLVSPPIEVLSKITLLMLVVSAAGLIVGSEVSERYRTAINLHEQSTYLNALIQNNPLGIVVFNRQGRVELANVAFGKLLQFDERDLSIGDIATLWLAEMPEVLPQALAGTPSHITVRQSRKDGRVLDLELHAVPLMVNGQVHGAYAIYEDISERVRASEAERKHAQSLNNLVHELQLHADHLTVLNEMGGRLERCVSSQEAAQVVAECVSNLFPEAMSETLYLLSSRNAMEAAGHWGGASISEPLFIVEACLSIPLGQYHWTWNANGKSCGHIRYNPNIKGLCAPILGGDNVPGVLHLEFATEPSSADQASIKRIQETQGKLAVTVAGQIARSLSSLRLREKLREQSIRDPLTTLFNRRFMEESLDRELQRARRRKYSVALLFFDLITSNATTTRSGMTREIQCCVPSGS